MTGPKNSKVFISYSWDSEEHKRKVRQLSDSLARDGIVVYLDKYVNFEGNWDTWMEEKVISSDYILMVITSRYLEIQKGNISDGGFGVAHEGLIIRSHIYRAHSKNLKFIPIFLSKDIIKLPSWMGIPSTFSLDDFTLDSTNENGYTLLYRVLTKQPIIPGQPNQPVINLGVSNSKIISANDVQGKLDLILELISEYTSIKSGLHSLREVIKEFCGQQKLDFLKEVAQISASYENFEKHRNEVTGLDHLEKEKSYFESIFADVFDLFNKVETFIYGVAHE